LYVSIVYFALGRLLRADAPSARGDLATDVDLLVLRHEVKVLSRGARRPALRRRDWILLATASRMQPRERERRSRSAPEPCSYGPGAGLAQVDLLPSGVGPGTARSGHRTAYRPTAQGEPPVGATSGSERPVSTAAVWNLEDPNRWRQSRSDRRPVLSLGVSGQDETHLPERQRKNDGVVVFVRGVDLFVLGP